MFEVKYPQSETNYENGSSTDKPWGFLAGMLFGGLAGAGAMLMLAPQSGLRTRVKIQKKSIELRDQATEAVDGAMSQARAKVNQVKSDVSKGATELKHRGKDMVDERVAQVNAVVDAGKDMVKGS